MCGGVMRWGDRRLREAKGGGGCGFPKSERKQRDGGGESQESLGNRARPVGGGRRRGRRKSGLLTNGQGFSG